MVRGSRALYLKNAGAISKALLDILVCPLSKQPLRYCQETQSLISDAIGVSFSVVHGIPCLVPKDGEAPPTCEGLATTTSGQFGLLLMEKQTVHANKFLIFQPLIYSRISFMVLEDVSKAWMANEEGSTEEFQMDCCVCLSSLDEGDETRKLPCRHVFHRDCVDRWFAMYRRTCPLCRMSIDAQPLSAGELDCGDELVIRFSAFLAPGY